MVTNAATAAASIGDSSREGLDEECRLVRLAKAGDNEAFAQLYDAHVSRVYRHIYYLVRDQAEAEDLTAQAFFKAWLAIGRYEERGKPIAAWFLRIGHNLALGQLRSRRARANIWVSLLVSEGPDAGSEMERHDEEDAVRSALARLPAEQRLVVILRFGEGLDHERVAQIIGKKAPNVRVIQHRALRRLRKMLTEAGQEGECS